MATVATASWNANTEIDLGGYRVYWGLDPNNYSTSGALTTATLSYLLDSIALSSDGLYSFTMDAFDTSANSSSKVTVVTKRIIRTPSKFVVRR
jgi:hypothetical protein